GILLSMFDENGRAQDGFLRAHEVFNLKLNADVVVLSACQTGLGKEVKGEGLVGLTRGFMYAGAPRVVVSLWSVNDAATAELMTRFYKGMLVDKLRPAPAQQAAQVSLLRDKRFAAPFYWAAFTLQGEWRYRMAASFSVPHSFQLDRHGRFWRSTSDRVESPRL